jgi:uncharacterized protein (DUF885 family)
MDFVYISISNPIYFMKKLAILLAAFLVITSCQEKEVAEESLTIDQEFDNFKEHFVEELWKIYPGWATGMGYDKYDTILTVPDGADRGRQFEFAKIQLGILNNYPIDSLSDHNQIDWLLIENELNSIIWNLEVFKKYQWDPSQYNVAGSIANTLTNKRISLDQKLEKILPKLKKIPAFYAAAKKNLKQSTIEHTELAIQQNIGAAKYLEQTLRDSLNLSATFEEKKIIENLISSSVNAINDYASWLEKEYLPELKANGAKDFRIGKDLFEQKFQYDIVSGYSAEEIYSKALARKEELHQEMLKISKELWDKYLPGKKQPADNKDLIKQVIDKIANRHVDRDEFIPAIEKQIPELEAFIKEKNLIYLDPSKPLVVRKTPDYMDGVAGASISSPGPYDKDGDTFYNVTPLTGYNDQEAESYLREYNHYILQILNIHEAIPGHYMQLVYSNQSPSIIKSIFGNGAMIEGWAVYTERMMLEEGYGNNEPEMWLMYYKWHLRVVCNTILDYSVHNLGWNEKDALNLLMNQAFQEEAEARGKWKRATLSQVQLCSYFTGYSEIYDLREELKNKQGEQFNLKEFHEKFLSYGSAPVKYIRRLMLQ